MQVFDVCTYNLKHIRFKDNKEYFDTLLNDLEMNYTDVAFCFHSDYDGSICDKAIKLFANLSEYKKMEYTELEHYFRGCRLSSISVDDNGGINMHIDRNHIDDFSGLLKKIPRPINFGYMGVMLDNINWGDIASNPCFKPNARGKIIADNHRFNCYYNDSIRFIKEFDYGNKLNIVEVIVERHGDFEQLSPLPKKFEEFCVHLGKPISKRTECVFSDEETTRWNSAEEDIKRLINKNEYDGLFAEFKKDYPKTPQGIMQEVMDSLVPVQGFSPKKIFTSAGKEHGFRYNNCINGLYMLKKVNAYNHTTTVSFMTKPFSSSLSADIAVCGYNFRLYVASFPEVTLDSDTKFALYANKVFEAADAIEKKFTEPLFQYYGKTPGWYEVG